MTEKKAKFPKRLPEAQDISQSLGKLPPQAVDVEESVLGAILLSSGCIIDVSPILKEEHFYTEAHKEIYRAVIELFANGDKIDMRTVVHHLRKAGKLETVGGAFYIAELTSKVSSAANVEYHARILVEMGMKRRLIALGSQIHQESYEDTSDVFEIVEKTNMEMQSILDSATSTQAEKSMKELTYEVLREQEARQAGTQSGLPSGYPAVDKILNGWNNTDLIILAARPGMGKTAFVFQSATYLAKRGVPVGVFSLEMGAKQLIGRAAVSASEIDSEFVKKGILNELDFKRYSAALGDLSGIPLFIDDTPMLTIVDLRARAFRMKTKHNIKMLIIDYLQLIKGVNEFGKNMNREQEIAQISRTLKGIAKELDIPVIALSQLGRGVETRGGSKRPLLSDLRESGSIEQDADVVGFLYRPEYYKITTDDDGFSTHGLCEVIIEKHRNGATGTVKVKFIGKFTKFSEWIGPNDPVPTSERQKYADNHYKDPTQQLPKDDDHDDMPF